MRLIDWIFIVGLTLSPMTGWRVGKVGPAEVIILAWCVFALLAERGHVRVGRYGLLWGLAYTVLLVSTAHGLIVTPSMTRPTDLVTWLYIGACSVLSVALLRSRTKSEIEPLLSRAGSIPTLWFGFLYVYSLVVSKSFLGAHLWFANTRYSGGADNPHHLALLLGACVFINLRSALRAGGLKRLWFLLVAALAIFLGLQTASSTLLVALAVPAAVTIVSMMLDRVPTPRGRVALQTLVVVVVGAIAALQWQRIITLIAQFLESDENGVGRLVIWTSFDQVLDKLLLLGLGPGSYANGGLMEFHNSYMEMAAMLGIPLTLIFAVLLFVRFRHVFTQWSLQVIVLSLLVYAIAGFSFRRISFWLLVALCIALSQKTSASEENPSNDAVPLSPSRQRAGLP